MLNIERHRVAANNRTLAVCVPGGMSLLLTKGQRFLFRAIAASMAACNAPELKMLRTCWPSRVTIKGQYSGQPTSGQYRSIHIWVKGRTGWQLVANQLTASADK